MAERLVWKVDLENDDMTASIRRFTTISKDNIENIETLIKKLQILDEIWQSLLEEPRELIEGLIPVFEKLINEGYPEYKFASLEIEDFIKERVRELISPSTESSSEETTGPETFEERVRHGKMKIGKDVFEIRNSYEILITTANWLIKQGKLKPTDCPVGIGYKRNLINKEPNHKYGEDFRAPKKLSNGLWIEVHYSTASCINNARRLLEKFGYSGSVLEVQ
jgi:hypothetical protein